MPQQNENPMGTRSAFFWLAAGLGLAGAVALAWPASAPWMLFAAALCFALALFLGSSRHDADDQITAAKTSPALGLPALAREVFERLPDPLMLVELSGRVIFANTAMTAVAGIDTQNKHISAVLRTPQVWQAIERTPLAAVSGFIDTLKGHAKDDERAREKFLDIMAVEAGRMRRLIDDLLSLTRIELKDRK